MAGAAVYVIDRVVTRPRGARTLAAPTTGARPQLVEPTLPGARNGGDILVHLRFDTEDQWRSVETGFAAALTDPAVTRVNGAAYSGDASRNGAGTGTVYRALLLRVL